VINEYKYAMRKEKIKYGQVNDYESSDGKSHGMESRIKRSSVQGKESQTPVEIDSREKWDYMYGANVPCENMLRSDVILGCGDVVIFPLGVWGCRDISLRYVTSSTRFALSQSVRGYGNNYHLETMLKICSEFGLGR